jgi:tetratricopeptide (TPR) repeat protein
MSRKHHSPQGRQSSAAGAQLLRRRGLALHRQGKVADAERVYEQALQARPNDFEVLLMYGVLASETQRSQLAAELFVKAINVNDRVAPVHNNLGLMLTKLNRIEEAVASFDRAIALSPKFADAHSNRGVALGQLKLHELALASYDTAISLEPHHARAYVGRGSSLQDLQCPAEAAANYDRAIALQPNYVRAYVNRGAALQELKRFDEALASYGKAIELNPKDAEAHVNIGFLYLLLGQFARGWPYYEWRKMLRPPIAGLDPFSPALGGTHLSGKTLLLHAEQGLGDTIQFCRYVRIAENTGARVVLTVQPQLRRLLASLGGAAEIIAAGSPVPAADLQCALASLPAAFATTLETIPAETPYLFPDQSRVARWTHKLGSHGFKIGICWQGSTGKPDIGRSLSLDHFHEISQIPGVRLISVQKNAGVEQLSTMPPGMRVETLGEDFDAGQDAFLDTAAVLQVVDLVITTDTSIAHLAGALRRPTWVALKHVPDWRWMLDREDSPWYPELRLFRQIERGDWYHPFVRIRRELVRRLGIG